MTKVKNTTKISASPNKTVVSFFVLALAFCTAFLSVFILAVFNHKTQDRIGYTYTFSNWTWAITAALSTIAAYIIFPFIVSLFLSGSDNKSIKKTYGIILSLIIIAVILFPLVINNIAQPSKVLPTNTPTPSPTIIFGTATITSPSSTTTADPPFLSNKGFPWTALAIFGAVIAALITRQASEAKRVTDQLIADNKRLSDEDIARARQAQERELAVIKQEQERIHFERTKQQDQFIDIQNRFDNRSPLTRSNASLRLAEFATHLDPAQNITTDSIIRNASNSPFFMPAVSLLTTGLYLETEEPVRRSVMKAITDLISFSKTSEDSRLLYVIAGHLADVNRASKLRFIQALALWASLDDRWIRIAEIQHYEEESEEHGRYQDQVDDLEYDIYSELVSMARLCDKRAHTIECFRLLMSEKEKTEYEESYFITQKNILKSKNLLQNESTTTLKASATADIELKAAQLKATCTILAQALKNLPLPNNFPAEFTETGEFLYNSGEGFSTPDEIDMSGCFLADSDLIESNLVAINAQSCYFIGANLRNANLQGAYLQNSSFYAAYLPKANLQFADLFGVDLGSADMTNCSIERALFMKAQMYKTKVYGCKVEIEHPDYDLLHTEFSQANWWDADFTANGKEDTALKQWFARYFPLDDF